MIRRYFGIAFVFGFLSEKGDARKARYEEFIQQNSPENLEKLENLEESELAEELSGQFQGDIIMSPEQMKVYEHKNMLRNGMLRGTYTWHDAIVPYRIIERDYDHDMIAQIKQAIRVIEEKTCVRFVSNERWKQSSFVTIRAEKPGCFSAVGRTGHEQILNLQPFTVGRGCFRLYTIVHELLHVLGFLHMQSATNRDEFVKINFDNIASHNRANFNKYGTNMISSYDVDYDYSSVLHYSNKAFSTNGRETIVPLKALPLGVVLGQRERLTVRDIKKVNRMYCERSNKKLQDWINTQ